MLVLANFWRKMTKVYFYFGLLSVFVGSVFSAVGMNLLKASSKLEKMRRLHHRWRFWLGIFLTSVVNTSLDAYAFAFVPVSVIAPFGGVCVVTSALIAYKGCITERELLDRLQWMCLLAIMGGVCLVGTFGPRPLPVTNATIILEGFEKPSFVVYQAVWGGTNLCAFALRFFRILKVQTLKETLLFGVSAGMSSGVTQCLMKALASMTAGEALVGNSDNVLDNLPYKTLQFWRAILQLALAGALLLYAMNICICSTDVGVSNAVYQSSLIIASIAAGSAFYGDLDDSSSLYLSLFLFGIALVIFGVSLLLTRHSYNQGKIKYCIPTQESVVSSQTTDVDASSVIDVDEIVDDIDQDPINLGDVEHDRHNSHDPKEPTDTRGRSEAIQPDQVETPPYSRRTTVEFDEEASEDSASSEQRIRGVKGVKPRRALPKRARKVRMAQNTLDAMKDDPDL